jgi:pyridoxal phosphate enzyme (YggS family)
MTSINYQHILQCISPFGAKLIVVSKFRSFEEIEMVKSWGQKLFGENRVQSLISKKAEHGSELSWHLIGTLQKNKVKSILPGVELIHSVDSFSLLQEINKEAVKKNHKQSCLFQFKIAQEDTKHGFSPEEVHSFLSSKEFESLKNIQIEGVMGMATNTDNRVQVKNEFKALRKIFEELKQYYFRDNLHFKEISAGMSDDYLIALDEGSTFIRIGSLVFNS